MNVVEKARDFLGTFLLVELGRGLPAHGAPSFQAQDHGAVSRREDSDQPALSRPACAQALPQRRGALHRLQAVRGRVPRARDHDRVRAARRRHPPHHTLRHRSHQVHLLRPVRGVLPGGLDRRDAHPRVPRREAWRPLLHQGNAARGGRPLRGARSPATAPRTRPTGNPVHVRIRGLLDFSPRSW